MSGHEVILAVVGIALQSSQFRFVEKCLYRSLGLLSHSCDSFRSLSGGRPPPWLTSFATRRRSHLASLARWTLCRVGLTGQFLDSNAVAEVAERLVP